MMKPSPVTPEPSPRRSGVALQLLLFFWLGGLWSIGYLVEPALQSRLSDMQEAQAVALYLKQVMVALGMVCGIVLALARWLRLARKPWLDLQLQLMAACLLASAGYLYQAVWAPVTAEREAVWYGLISLLAVGLAVNHRPD